MSITSPCTGICKLDEATGWCLGCARTGDEIADWRFRGEAERAAVWDALPERFAALGVSCRRLPWTTEEIRDFVVQSLGERLGTWTIGVVGGLAEFASARGAPTQVETLDNVVTARTDGGRLRFVIDDDVRALTFEAASVSLARSRIVLAVKRERGRPAVSDRLAALGPDGNAVSPGDRTAELFDLGLGRKEARFCVRCASGNAKAVLSRSIGSRFPDNLPQIGPTLLAESPTRVVESALGRIEVSSRIPMPGGTSPPGPHTHLLPYHLATGRAVPAGMDLPRVYLPGSIFYPQP
jgi:predicted Fe-S protein YdhL (DUF1289 family)